MEKAFVTFIDLYFLAVIITAAYSLYKNIYFGRILKKYKNPDFPIFPSDYANPKFLVYAFNPLKRLKLIKKMYSALVTQYDKNELENAAKQARLASSIALIINSIFVYITLFFFITLMLTR